MAWTALFLLAATLVWVPDLFTRGWPPTRLDSLLAVHLGLVALTSIRSVDFRQVFESKYNPEVMSDVDRRHGHGQHDDQHVLLDRRGERKTAVVDMGTVRVGHVAGEPRKRGQFPELTI
jgi:hypothetical protein